MNADAIFAGARVLPPDLTDSEANALQTLISSVFLAGWAGQKMDHEKFNDFNATDDRIPSHLDLRSKSVGTGVIPSPNPSGQFTLRVKP
jgi:hypothetical protein